MLLRQVIRRAAFSKLNVQCSSLAASSKNCNLFANEQVSSRVVRPNFSFVNFKYFSNTAGNDNKNAKMEETQEESKSDDQQNETESDDDVNNIKMTILDNALDYVHEFGWTQKAISYGAEEAGYASTTEGMFKGGGADLVMHFVKQSNQQLVHHLQESVKRHEENEEKVKTTEIIQDAIEFRLRLIIPYMNVWSEAMTLLLSPSVLSESSDELSKMVDDIWYYAGDKSTDINWYTKRGLLAKMYGSAQLVMLTDQSPDFKDTWEFLDRRMKDIMFFGNVTRDIKERGEALYNLTFSGASILRNVAGFPKKKR